MGWADSEHWIWARVPAELLSLPGLPLYVRITWTSSSVLLSLGHPMPPSEGGGAALLLSCPWRQLTSAYASKASFTRLPSQGIGSTFSSVATCEGLDQPSCPLILGAGSHVYIRPIPLCCPEEVWGPLSQVLQLVKDRSHDLQGQLSKLLQVVRGRGQKGVTSELCHLTAGDWQGQFSLTLTLGAGLSAPLSPGSARLYNPDKEQDQLS